MGDGDGNHTNDHPHRDGAAAEGHEHETTHADATGGETGEQRNSSDDKEHAEQHEGNAGEPVKADVENETSSIRSPHVALASASSLVLPLTDPILSLDPDVSSVDELVAMLRGQITDLAGQVSSLNSKLVKSYTQRGEIEDDLHDTKEQEALLKMRVAELERDQARWTKEIEAGGWVEKVRPTPWERRGDTECTFGHN